MQLFPCPFCGLRNETEFHYVAEVGKTRPDTRSEVSDEAWGTYLHTQRNEKGPVREVWLHQTCSELFVMERDSVTMEVQRSFSLREDTT